jgi:hypothetical protein
MTCHLNFRYGHLWNTVLFFYRDSTQNRQVAARAQAVCIHLDDAPQNEDEGVIKLTTKNGAGGRVGIPHTLYQR